MIDGQDSKFDHGQVTVCVLLPGISRRNGMRGRFCTLSCQAGDVGMHFACLTLFESRRLGLFPAAVGESRRWNGRKGKENQTSFAHGTECHSLIFFAFLSFLYLTSLFLSFQWHIRLSCTFLMMFACTKKAFSWAVEAACDAALSLGDIEGTGHEVLATLFLFSSCFAI